MKLHSSKSPLVINNGLQVSTPISNKITYLGSALGGFSASNKVLSSANQIQDFRPGKTLWLVYQSIGVNTSTTELVVGSCTSTASDGWRLTRQANTGIFFILSNAGGSLAFKQMFTPVNGINVVCIVWKSSDTSINYSINGTAFTSPGGALTAPSAATSSWLSGIGTPISATDGTIPFTSGRVLAYAIWNSEATSAQAQKYTATTGNRFQLPSAVLSSAVVDFNASRDWNGVASTITTKGSSPIVFNVSGSPSLVPCDEVRYSTAGLKYYFDTGISLPVIDGSGNKYTIHDSYSHVKCKTDALTLALEAYNNCTVQSVNCNIGVYTNGSYVTSLDDSAASQINIPVVFNVQPGAGTNKTVDLIEAGQAMQGTVGTFPYTRGGVFITAVRLPKYLYDGTTSSNSSMILPTTVQKKLVLLGDSILTGFVVTTFQSQSIPALLRSDFPTSGTGGVVAHTAGSDSMANAASTTTLLNQTVAQLVAELNGTSSNILWIELGTNDYGASPISTANFQTYYGNLVDAVRARVPNVQIYCQSPIQRISPASEAANGLGFTLGDYRTAISNVAAARPTFCTYINGAAAAIVSDANMYTDGIHITAAGAAQYKAFIKSTLGY